ncbi:hypothetical protein ElyMa_003081300 [Elysia marginata]|uniref:Uncharacterized protein n=1 Tax=Elysia marginata TaxID=1093978 RepID=A0AAV4IN39_9GAST|nr:hypothetical protein ElyMa_003081300 [Elysia marginata]
MSNSWSKDFLLEPGGFTINSIRKEEIVNKTPKSFTSVCNAIVVAVTYLPSHLRRKRRRRTRTRRTRTRRITTTTTTNKKNKNKNKNKKDKNKSKMNESNHCTINTTDDF